MLDNGNKELEKLPESDNIPMEALEKVDLDLPVGWQDEIFASQLLDTITSYHAYQAQLRSARHQGDSGMIDKLSKQVAFCRNLAALIQHEHPSTVVLYKELAVAKASELSETRRARTRITEV